MDGIHLLGEWYGCPADTPELTRRRRAARAVPRRGREAAGLTIVGDRFHQFEPQGVTGTVLLAESHLAIHTWPEIGFVTVDVYVCNYTTDNTAQGRARCSARWKRVLQARAHALPGDPARGRGWLKPAGRPRARAR